MGRERERERERESMEIGALKSMSEVLSHGIEGRTPAQSSDAIGLDSFDETIQGARVLGRAVHLHEMKSYPSNKHGRI